MNAFVIVKRNEEWRFGPYDLGCEIKSRWPDTVLSPATKTTSLSWQICSNDPTKKSFRGFLSADCRVVGFDGDEKLCANFAIWLRTVVPNEVALAVGDDLHGNVLDVSQLTNAFDVSAFWRS